MLKGGSPLFAVECKTGERNLSPHIHYFRERTKIPAFYQVHLGTKDFGHPAQGRRLPLASFSRELGLV
ncbi:MAG: hypothetical protein HUU37_07650 [Bdellovibrionales bacterium]|nr:hypothetical protein [Bdellovibrionales bacterium]